MSFIINNKNNSKLSHQYEAPYELEIWTDKNDQIHDIQPRTYKGVDIFSKYHNTPYKLTLSNIMEDMYQLYMEI